MIDVTESHDDQFNKMIDIRCVMSEHLGIIPEHDKMPTLAGSKYNYTSSLHLLI